MEQQTSTINFMTLMAMDTVFNPNFAFFFAELIAQIGWESDTALGLMMVNLAMDNPQIAWYVNTLDIGVYYERKQVEEMLSFFEIKKRY